MELHKIDIFPQMFCSDALKFIVNSRIMGNIQL